MKRRKVHIPHLREDKGRALASKYADALVALSTAKAALEKCAPVSEDYGTDTFQLVTDEHTSRVASLNELAHELIEVIEGINNHIQGQGKK